MEDSAHPSLIFFLGNRVLVAGFKRWSVEISGGWFRKNWS
jgi:hypothetical protein